MRNEKNAAQGSAKSSDFAVEYYAWRRVMPWHYPFWL